MEKKTQKQKIADIVWDLSLDDFLQEFLLSREAAGASKGTIKWYEFQLRRFIVFCNENGYTALNQIDSRVIDKFLLALREAPSKVSGKPLTPRYIHGYARNILTMLRYAKGMDYIDNVPHVTKPRVPKKKLVTLTVDEIKQVLDACQNSRDRLVILLAVDSGLRLAEITDLRWGDLDLRTGRLEVRKGKGGKYRVAAVGKQTLRAALKYARELKMVHPRNTDPDQAMFQNHEDFSPLGARGLQSAFLRIRRRSGVEFSAHALRRTFAKMSVKSGMSIIVIQQLMGHSQIETTRDYIQQLDDEDILENHRAFGVVDHMLKY